MKGWSPLGFRKLFIKIIHEMKLTWIIHGLAFQETGQQRAILHEVK